MPELKPGSKVLVTGVNGYAGMWAAQRLLDRGYSVRGTARSIAKGTHQKEYFQSYGERFELAVVDDFTKEGAFDESLVGVDGVLHVATPFPSAQLTDPKELMKISTDATIGLMKSALKFPNIKRIVYTSTVGAIDKLDVTEPIILSEKDWNDEAVDMVEQKGAETPGVVQYFASKVVAERAAWDFYESNKNTSSYDFAVINPTWIFGPPIHDLGNDPSGLVSSIVFWYNNVLQDGPKPEETLSTGINWIDVRDLADAHVTALEKKEASGQRIILNTAQTSWQQLIDVANDVQNSDSPVSLTHPLPRGIPGIPEKHLFAYDTSQEKCILGTKFRDLHEMTRDMLAVFSKKGW